MSREAAVEIVLALGPELVGLVFLLGWFMFRALIRGVRRILRALLRGVRHVLGQQHQPELSWPRPVPREFGPLPIHGEQQRGPRPSSGDGMP